MMRIFGMIALMATLSFSQNMIEGGVLKIGGGVSAQKYSDGDNELTVQQIAPSVNYFMNENLGLGCDLAWYRSVSDHSDPTHQLSIVPTLIFVSEKPIWPIYFSGGLSYFTHSDTEYLSEYLIGWQVETGLYVFLNDHVAIIPKVLYQKDSEAIYSEKSLFSVSLGYFFHGRKN